jgi:hypothetical protein
VILTAPDHQHKALDTPTDTGNIRSDKRTPTGHPMPRRCGDHGQDQRSLT